MKDVDLNFWLCPIMGVTMIVIVLWRHFFSSRRMQQQPDTIPEPLSVPETSRSLVRPVYQQQFLKRLSETVAWTAQVSPATWQEMKTMGRIVAHETQTTVADGGSEAGSEGYVDVYDLPPVDTWIYLSGGTGGSNPILYCWVPNPFVDAMQGAIDVSCMANYEWADIDQLLSDYRQ